MTRHASMLVTLGLAALLPAVSGCGDSRASTSSGEPAGLAGDGGRVQGAHAGGGGAAAVDGAESSATRPPRPAPAAETAAVGPDPLVNGYDSIDALGRAVVDALSADDAVAAWAVIVDANEYQTRLFPALVNHPSALKLGADLAWTNMAGESRGDLKTALQQHGGKVWRFIRIDVPKTKDRGELQTHLDPKLVVADEAGVEHTLQILGPIVEHRATGTFKLLTYRD